MGKTNIEWTQFTLNPFVGCSKCSPGCEHCFAERFAARLAKNPKMSAKYAGVVDDKGHWTGHISQLDLSCFDKLPKKPSRVFVGSMTDLFYDIDDYKHVNKVMDIFVQMEILCWHTFMLLTKRPENAIRFFQMKNDAYMQVDKIKKTAKLHLIKYKLPDNIWLGVTVCNQEEVDNKIPILLQIPAAKRFISVEPMLGPVDIMPYLQGNNKLDWVICGGETGKNARPMHEKWVKNLRDQCLETGIPFFFKSWGEWIPAYQKPNDFGNHNGALKYELMIKFENDDFGNAFYKVGKKLSGHLIDGVEYRQFPEG